jgi:hydrogenase small subunit
MATPTQTNEMSSGQPTEEPVVHILWMNGGLGCDGDSVALTGATQPSIEEIALGALPGLPKTAFHWPLIDYECGPEQGADNFIEWWHKGEHSDPPTTCRCWC